MFFLSILFFHFSKETPIRITSQILKLNYLNSLDVVGQVSPSIDMPNNWVLTITNPEFLDLLKIERFNLEHTIFGTKIYYHSKCVTATEKSLGVDDCVDNKDQNLLTQRFDLKIVHPVGNIHIPFKTPLIPPFIDSTENFNKINETFSSVKNISKKRKVNSDRSKKSKDEKLHLNSKDIEIQEQLRNFISLCFTSCPFTSTSILVLVFNFFEKVFIFFNT